MNDAEVKKVYEALRIGINLEAQLKNFVSRGPRAGTAWATWAKDASRKPQEKTAIKPALVTYTKLSKNVKLTLKDLDSAMTGAKKEKLAKFANGKEYRDKVLKIALKSVNVWGIDAKAFLDQMKKVSPPMSYPQNSKDGVDEVATIAAIKNYVHYYGELAKALQTIG